MFNSFRWLVCIVLANSAFASCWAADIETTLTGVLKKAVNHRRINSPQGPVIVGAFVGNAQQDLSSGSGIRKKVADRLKAMGVNVQRRGKFPVLSGEYSFCSDPDASIDLTLKVQDSQGREVGSFPERISYRDDMDTLLDTTAPTTTFPAGQSNKQRAEVVEQAIAEPRVEIELGSTHAVGGHCSLALVVNDKPCSVVDDSGVAFATIERGSRYIVRLKNSSQHAFVASVSIDGLDTFAFSELPGRPAGFVVPAGGSFDLQGWFINRQRADSFIVGSFAQSASAKELGAAAEAGVIVAKFRIAWPKGQEPPHGELPPDLPRSADGTLRGEPVQQKLRSVPLDIGSLREIVSIRYGT